MPSCGLRWFSSQQRNYAVNAHLRESTEQVSGNAEEVVVRSSFNTQWTFPTALEGIRCRPHRRDLTSMFMTIGGADTLCPLQLFRIVTFFVALFRQRNTRALSWPCKPARDRTLRTKLGVSRQRLATSSRSRHSPGIAEKFPVRSCRKFHPKTAEQLFVYRL